jgi:1-acyl-sn-glycerol-3-phosphate acyltransferase
VIERIFYKFGKYFVAFYSFLAFKIDLKKVEKFPLGPKIFVANHPSTTDPFLTLLIAREKVSILIKESLFKIAFFGFILKHSGHIPVNAKNGNSAFEKAKSVLLNGKSIVVFVEGDISPSDSEFRKPKTGAVRLSLMTGAPIIPIGFGLIHKRLKIFHTKNEEAHWYIRGPYAITIGKALKLKGKIDDFEFVRSESLRIMNEIITLVAESKLRLVPASL